jgi:hypothetical protein
MLHYANSERYLGETFFTSEKLDGRLTCNVLPQIFQKLSKESGIHFHAHKLRHTSATSLADSGANAFEIQQQLGHSSMEISLRYVHLNDGNRKTRSSRDSSNQFRTITLGLDLGTTTVKGVRDVVEEDQTENDVLVLGGFHVTAKFVGDGPARFLDGLDATGTDWHLPGSCRGAPLLSLLSSRTCRIAERSRYVISRR